METLDCRLAIACHATHRLTRRTGRTPQLTVAQIADATGATPAQIRQIEAKALLRLSQTLRRQGITKDIQEALRSHRHATDQRN